jgi:hypothetical protein
MRTIKERMETFDWTGVSNALDHTGYAILHEVLSSKECDELLKRYQDAALYRKTIVMERYRFGLGEYKYFNYPLPDIIQSIRESVYPKLAPVANNWMKALNIEREYPDSFESMQQLSRAHGQTKPTVLILKYGKGGYNTLHQDLYGQLFFPMQVVLFLNEPGIDYTGGEFVLTQQTPRAQSTATVLKPGKGDMLIFTTNFRPVKGVKGYYRVNMKHGVSQVLDGNRHSLGIIFHDALQ